MELTHHAAQRLQQRAIPERALELLRRYGRSEYASGARIRYFDRRSLQRAMRAVGVEDLEPDRLHDMYYVESKEGVVVTAGHRTRRIKRDYRPGLRKARRRARRPHGL